MNLETVLQQLQRLGIREYGYVGLAATVGPLVLRGLGFKMLGNLLRPAALLVILGGLYARQQKGTGTHEPDQFTAPGEQAQGPTRWL